MRPISVPMAGLRRLSINRKLHLISAVYILIIFGLLGLSQLAVGFLSDVRSYVGGEGLWSKSQKDAVYFLATYVTLQREADYKRYIKAMRVPQGDHEARLELSTPSPNLALAEQGFINGRNHPMDVAGMATLFVRFGRFPYLSQAITIWGRADDVLAELEGLGIRIHDEVRVGKLTQVRQEELLRRIDILNDRLTQLEDGFSFTLGAGAREIRSKAALAMLVLTAFALAAGTALSTRISNRIGHGILALRAGTRRVAAGDLGEPIVVQSTDEIGELADAFNRMTASLQRHIAALEEAKTALADMDELKTQFFANVSHELRTPLSLILGPADRLLHASELSEPVRRDLSAIERNAQLLHKRVNDLMDVARLDAGKSAADYAEVDLARLTRRVVSHFEILADERRIELLTVAPVKALAAADPEKIERVLFNLLSNAFKFTPAGGRIEVALDESGTELMFRVRDSGPGVPSRLRTAIFERFRQGDGNATRQHGGTGLGLAIVREFVTLHGGRVWVQSAADGGAEFCVALPRQAPVGHRVAPVGGDDHVAMATRARPILEELSPPIVSGVDRPVRPGAPLVLVVEDNPEMNRYIVETLSPLYRTASARDGLEGLQQALDLQPDLIVSDVMMPRMSGDRFLAELRARPEAARIPFLVLTAKADDSLRIRLLRSGAQDFLIKPFSSTELVTRAENLIAIKQTHDELERELGRGEASDRLLADEASRSRRELQKNVEQLHRREVELRLALQERDVLLKEVHHRVKNNLQVIVSLLNLQRSQLEDKESASALLQCQERIRAMALIHDKLYERGDLSRVDLGDYVQALVGSLLSTYQGSARHVHAEVSMPELAVDAEVAIPCGLILHELVSNALRHAFPSGRGGRIWVRGKHEPGASLILEVRDDGAGLPATVDFEHPATLGLQLVSSLTAQLGGKLSHSVDKGTSFTVELAA
jgi:signal transduction histidine kinase